MSYDAKKKRNAVKMVVILIIYLVLDIEWGQSVYEDIVQFRDV